MHLIGKIKQAFNHPGWSSWFCYVLGRALNAAYGNRALIFCFSPVAQPAACLPAQRGASAGMLEIHCDPLIGDFPCSVVILQIRCVKSKNVFTATCG